MKSAKKMKSKKAIPSQGEGKRMSPQMADMLSKQQGAYQKSEEHNFPVRDEAKEARRIHTNGSTPRERS